MIAKQVKFFELCKEFVNDTHSMSFSIPQTQLLWFV